MIRSHLARANRYIAELRADIARERVIIEQALDAGYPSAVAESMEVPAGGGPRAIPSPAPDLIGGVLYRPTLW
jgi:hypothetical protein